MCVCEGGSTGNCDGVMGQYWMMWWENGPELELWWDNGQHTCKLPVLDHCSNIYQDDT